MTIDSNDQMNVQSIIYYVHTLSNNFASRYQTGLNSV